MDGVSLKKKVFSIGTLCSMRQNTPAQNEAVKWKVDIDTDINKVINNDGMSIILITIES